MLRVYIQDTHPYLQEVTYTWNIVAEAIGIIYASVDNKELADISIGNNEEYNIYAPEYYFKQIIEHSQYNFRLLFTEGPILMHQGKLDYLATIFFLVNSIQEYYSTDTDELGRFLYKDSYQSYFNNITENHVLSIIYLLFRNIGRENIVNTKNRKSKIVLSHDIDSLYGSFIQDGLWALKHARFDIMLKLFFNVVTSNQHWFNIDKIMKIESVYDFKSTFFWLVYKGKINDREVNADYSISSIRLTDTLSQVKENGYENGLHKSISEMTFDEELSNLPISTNLNRNHYLKFSLPQHYNKLDESGILCDASLGFAEHYGYRNSYGLPFTPFDIKKRKPYTFKEVPLHCMDGTFQRYLKIPVNETASTIIGFIEKNKSNSILSILWHNTFFTDYKYKGYLNEYKKILAYLHESKLETISYSDILNDKYL